MILKIQKKALDVSVLKRLTSLYESEDMRTSLLKQILKVSSLKQFVASGTDKTVLNSTDMKNIQKYIEWLANPRTGRDRLALAMAYLRDYFKAPTADTRVAELEGCLEQLVTLYDYMFEDGPVI